MKSNYRKIGSFIRLVDNRNKYFKITNLLGLTTSKKFIPSVGNIIGADMLNYKIIRKNQFACSLMQVRRDKKIPVALYNRNEDAIISQAYPIFEITNAEELYPEYLMMWMSRSEFDRESCFHAVGGVRGSLEWEDFCNLELPVPDIEIQKEIVKEYNMIINRIEINNKLIQKCEKTAQTIYKQWFIDFEFPDENGKPYKSNSGEMEYNEELSQEIPVSWEVKTFEEVTQISAGGDKPKVYSNVKTEQCLVPIYANGETNEGLYGYTNEPKIFDKCITISARGTIGYCMLRKEPFVPIVRLLVVIPNKMNAFNYIYKYVDNFDFDSSGSVQDQLTKPQFSSLGILMPQTDILEKFESLTSSIFIELDNRKEENKLLQELKEILLSKMSKIIPIEVTQ